MMPFTGERCVCIFCADVLQSSVTTSSNWRCVDLDGMRFYACPKHFPGDGASAEEFKAAYMAFIKRAVAARMGKN